MTIVETINVTVGELFTLQIEAYDPDGDNITFELLDTVQNASISAQVHKCQIEAYDPV